MTTSAPRLVRTLLALILLPGVAALGGPSSVAAQAPERSTRFEAADLRILSAATPDVPADALRARSAVAGPMEDFAVILGIFGGAFAGGWIGCMIDCAGDIGPSGAVALGVLIGMPVGAALLVWAARTETLATRPPRL